MRVSSLRHPEAPPGQARALARATGAPLRRDLRRIPVSQPTPVAGPRRRRVARGNAFWTLL